MALWRVDQAADYLGIRPKTLYEWVRTGRVPHRKLGFNVRFDPDELAHWVREGGSQRRGAPSTPASGGLDVMAVEAAHHLRRLESDLGAHLSFPQRREIRALAERLEQAVTDA